MAEGGSRPVTVLMISTSANGRGPVKTGRGGAGKHLVAMHGAKCPLTVIRRLDSWRSAGKDVDSMRNAWHAARVPSPSVEILTSLLQKCQLRCRTSTLAVDRGLTWAVAPPGGRISVISRVFDHRYGGSGESADFCNRLLRPHARSQSDSPRKGNRLGIPGASTPALASENSLTVPNCQGSCPLLCRLPRPENGTKPI